MSQIRTLADFAITISSGTVSTSVLGSGTANSNTYLAGDNTWKTIQSGLLLQSVQSNNFTAVAGNSYPVNTANGAITVTLPASPVSGQQIQIIDYAGTANANTIILNPNGKKINGSGANSVTSTARASVSLVYVDSTQGWVDSSIGNAGYLPQQYSASYLVVAGGGGGGNNAIGGGGGGGVLTGSLTLAAGTLYSITVGAGGTVGPGTQGTNSSFSTITAAGGGYGSNGETVGGNGASGGGGGFVSSSSGAGSRLSGGSGTSGQGNAGGYGEYNGQTYGGGGGGGAGAVGGNTSGTTSAGSGGNGISSTITGSSVTYAGGGGSGGRSITSGSGGTGGGGAGNNTTTGTSGAVNTGGGGGGGWPSGAGGSGVVILSVQTLYYSGVYTGAPTITTSGTNTILTFTSSGSYTA